MRVAIRADTSLQIGTGHIMRCLTLADELRGRGAEVRFICREHPGHLVPLLRDAGYPTAVLPASASAGSIQNAARDDYAAWLGVGQSEDAAQTLEALGDFMPDWLVVDHYGLDATWERLLRPKVGRVFVIDDLADRPHDCDVLLDQNFYQDTDTRYTGLLPHHARQLLGPRFALLRSEFRKARESLRERDGTVRRILIFFGGLDTTNETTKAIESLLALSRPDIEVDVVMGRSNSHLNQITRLCATAQNFHFHCQVTNMAELMASADLAIGGGGTTTWERCYLGLPTIVLVIADNQCQMCHDLAATGTIVNLGDAGSVSVEKLLDALSKLIANKERRMELSRRSLRMMSDARESVASILIQDTHASKR